MGLFDAFRGSKKPAAPAAASEDGTSSSSEITNADSEQFTSDGASSSSSGAFNATSDFSPSFSDDTRVYNPYAGISAALDKRDVKQGFVLPSEPQFLYVLTLVATLPLYLCTFCAQHPYTDTPRRVSRPLMVSGSARRAWSSDGVGART